MTREAMVLRVRELHRQREAADPKVDVDVKVLARRDGRVLVSEDGTDMRGIWLDEADCDLEDAGRWTILTLRRDLALRKGLI